MSLRRAAILLISGTIYLTKAAEIDRPCQIGWFECADHQNAAVQAPIDGLIDAWSLTELVVAQVRVQRVLAAARLGISAIMRLLR